MHTVSVIMPAYNAARFITESVESILSQNFEDWELLVADDGSADRTRAIVESFQDPRIRKFNNRTNMGYLETCNLLFHQAKGAYITFQDADDVSLPSRLECQVESLNNDPSLGVCGTWAKTINVKGKVTGIDRRPTAHEEILGNRFVRNCFCGATMMIRREVYETIGGYRHFFRDLGYEDYDWSNLIVEQFRGCNIPEPLYLYRQHSHSITKTISPKRLVSGDIVKHLTNQRVSGLDDLQAGRDEQLELLLWQLLEPYRQDPALVYRKYAGSFLYSGLKLDAMKVALRAIAANPRDHTNWRTFLYCVRKSLGLP